MGKYTPCVSEGSAFHGYEWKYVHVSLQQSTRYVWRCSALFINLEYVWVIIELFIDILKKNNSIYPLLDLFKSKVDVGRSYIYVYSHHTHA